MTIEEAASTAKAIYLQAAALAGREVAPDSPEALAGFVRDAFEKVDESRKREAVANLLRLLSNIIDSPMERDGRYHESNVGHGANKTCPVYPFD
jgi:vacuolar-type H+-ATPase subunit E/Vma4